MWEKLIDSTENYFREGVLVKFKTLDTAGDEYNFALGVRIDHNEDISFLALAAGLGAMVGVHCLTRLDLKEKNTLCREIG